jgi:hypothetical protein
MKINCTWVSLVFVVVASSFCSTGCIAESNQFDDDQFDDQTYEVQEANTDWSVESTEEGQEEDSPSDDEEDSEQWGLCGPKCTKI